MLLFADVRSNGCASERWGKVGWLFGRFVVAACWTGRLAWISKGALQLSFLIPPSKGGGERERERKVGRSGRGEKKKKELLAQGNITVVTTQ